MYIILHSFVFITLQGEETLRKIPEQPSMDVSFDGPEGDTSIGKPIMEQNETSPCPELAQACLANDFLRR
jgi:hypothetical protein